MSEFAIHVEGLSKQYRIGERQPGYFTLRDALLGAMRAPFRRLGGRQGNTRLSAERDKIWALKEVSFDVRHGEVVGVIGSNGAGKSTLLKILSRITEPTMGFAEIRGRVRALLEVGTGFHGELTGRENIFLNGAILGMSKEEIRRKFDEIVTFSEIEEFLDTPVKHYSSGMFVRLAFAVAAHLEPEILIIDEVLSVGDVAFQNKCLGKISEVTHGGRTVLFVSHNMASIENLCEQCLFLRHGKIEFVGDAKSAIKRYITSASGNRQQRESHVVDLTTCTRRPEYPRPLLQKLEVFSAGRPLTGGLPLGAPLTLRITFRLEKPTADFHINVGFDNLLGQRVFTANTLFEPTRVYEARKGEQVFVCDLPSLPFVPGEYIVKTSLILGAMTTVDAVEDAMRLQIVESDFYGTGRSPWNGVVVLNHHWRLMPSAGS